MGTHSKSYAFSATALVFLVVLEFLAQTPNSNFTPPSAINQIVVDAAKLDAFNCYNTNGTPPLIVGNSAFFSGTPKTNMFQDLVSHSTVTANKSIVLQAQIAANVTSFSMGEDQFAVFVTDDIISFKSDEFGFVLPEMGNTWYAYIQSPQIQGFFVWKPLMATNSLESCNFKAVYANDGFQAHVDFYVDGKLVWSTIYSNVTGKDFHLVLTSHKVSAENVDTSQNRMQVDNASLSDRLEQSSKIFL